MGTLPGSGSAGRLQCNAQSVLFSKQDFISLLPHRDKEYGTDKKQSIFHHRSCIKSMPDPNSCNSLRMRDI
jgi:hypothetical protein